MTLALVAVATPIHAQPAVHVDVRETADTPHATVALHDLLGDGRFVRAMRRGFPMYVEYEVALREDRAFADRTVHTGFVDLVFLHDPLRDLFVVEDEVGREELGSQAALARHLATIYVFELPPDGAGTFYYEATVRIRTLTPDDVEEVFAWWEGRDTTTASSGGRGNVLTRGARRLLVALAPLPRLRLSAASPRFRRR